MVEVEIKVPIGDRSCLKEKLLCAGFSEGDLVKETDYYFDSEVNKIRENGKALRIRCCENFTSNLTEHFMTFKGEKIDQISMSREELEMKIESSDMGKAILVSLGYYPVRPVIKHRQYYRKDRITVCLDQVEGLGDYMEIEIIVPCKEEKPAALERIYALLHRLGYEKSDVISTSYLSLLQTEEK